MNFYDRGQLVTLPLESIKPFAEMLDETGENLRMVIKLQCYDSPPMLAVSESPLNLEFLHLVEINYEIRR